MDTPADTPTALDLTLALLLGLIAITFIVLIIYTIYHLLAGHTHENSQISHKGFNGSFNPSDNNSRQELDPDQSTSGKDIISVHKQAVDSYLAFHACFRDPSSPHQPPDEEKKQIYQYTQWHQEMLFALEPNHSCEDGACKGRRCSICDFIKCEQEFRVKGRKAMGYVCRSCGTLQSKLIAFHICKDGMCEGHRCHACSRLRCLDYFRKDPRTPQHRQSHCIDCANERLGGYDKELYESLVADYEEMRKTHRRVRQANLKQAKERASHPITKHDWNELKAHYDYRCVCCGRKEPAITLTLDHVVSISSEGSHSIENVQPLCQQCNSEKSTHVVDYRPLFHPRGKNLD